MNDSDTRNGEATDDQMMVQAEFNALLNDYLQSNHRRKVGIVTKAFHFANQAHAGAKRLSGEPYIMHPLAVARIVCREMGLGSTSICSALLHDVVEDTDFTTEDIENLFDAKIARIVDGLTKISGGIFAEQASLQAENFRKLLLTMNYDIRVILVKMADRLHNMRTLGSMLPAKQYKIAGETIYLYAPLAHRLGLFAVKTELEDLSFKYEHFEEYDLISRKLSDSEGKRNELFEHFRQPIDRQLKEMGMDYEMKARVKSVYSIYSKMESKGITLDDIYDIYAVRIIFEPLPGVDEKKQCWDIYSTITDIYRINPERIRDWVSHPRANGYQALHLTVMGPDGEWVEIQVRSRRMDDIAERGYAAHWKYKDSSSDENTELDKWVQTITEILESPTPSALDFLDNIKLNLYATEIFVFTPKGDLKTLPQNATALDFAYSLHTNIGNTCIGAKVNHRLVPLSHPLHSGDQVEILTSRAHGPQVEWLGYVTTARAHSKIDSFLKRLRKEAARAGEEKVLAAMKRNEMEPTALNIENLAVYHGFPKREDFFYAVEKADVVLPDNLKKFLKEKTNSSFFKYIKRTFRVSDSSKIKLPEAEAEAAAAESGGEESPKIDKSKPYLLKDEGFVRNYFIADCCKPIPGDESLGFVNDKKEVVVHKRSCPIATRLKSSFGERILDTRWSNHVTSFDATLQLKGIDAIGVLYTITKTISAYNVSIQRLLMESKDGIFEGKIKMQVHDVEDIQRMCIALSKIEQVQSVGRVAD
ncbi:Guanosine-3',5'-bis(diphosphate) 3'-pyrophosphohydrolase [Bacteroidales bacterium Barb6XT]|nr:Guanosine-3',5'-bis(diphosphate) 3'-pyrophosphohydrolase [Bacteroidales bacterium Barb6XT]